MNKKIIKIYISLMILLTSQSVISSDLYADYSYTTKTYSSVAALCAELTTYRTEHNSYDITYYLEAIEGITCKHNGMRVNGTWTGQISFTPTVISDTCVAPQSWDDATQSCVTPVDCTENPGELFPIQGIGTGGDFVCIDNCSYENVGETTDVICNDSGHCVFVMTGKKTGSVCTGNEGVGGVTDPDEEPFHNFECPAGTHKEVSKCNSKLTYCVADGDHLVEGDCTDVQNDPKSPEYTPNPTPPKDKDGNGSESEETTTTTGTDVDGNPTTTTTTTKTITDGNGNTSTETSSSTTTDMPDGTKKTTKDKATTNKETASYGGCGANFICKGNPVECAAAKIAYDHRCSMVYTPVGEETPVPPVADSNDEIDISEIIDDTGFLSNRTCPSDLTFSAMGKSHSISLIPLCTLAEWIGIFIIASSSFIGIRIALGG